MEGLKGSTKNVIGVVKFVESKRRSGGDHRKAGRSSAYRDTEETERQACNRKGEAEKDQTSREDCPAICNLTFNHSFIPTFFMAVYSV